MRHIYNTNPTYNSCTLVCIVNSKGTLYVHRYTVNTSLLRNLNNKTGPQFRPTKCGPVHTLSMYLYLPINNDPHLKPGFVSLELSY